MAHTCPYVLWWESTLQHWSVHFQPSDAQTQPFSVDVSRMWACFLLAAKGLTKYVSCNLKPSSQEKVRVHYKGWCALALTACRAHELKTMGLSAGVGFFTGDDGEAGIRGARAKKQGLEQGGLWLQAKGLPRTGLLNALPSRETCQLKPSENKRKEAISKFQHHLLRDLTWAVLYRPQVTSRAWPK